METCLLFSGILIVIGERIKKKVSCLIIFFYKDVDDFLIKSRTLTKIQLRDESSKN